MVYRKVKQRIGNSFFFPKPFYFPSAIVIAKDYSWKTHKLKANLFKRIPAYEDGLVSA